MSDGYGTIGAHDAYAVIWHGLQAMGADKDEAHTVAVEFLGAVKSLVADVQSFERDDVREPVLKAVEVHGS